jgi:hypothetical protein
MAFEGGHRWVEVYAPEAAAGIALALPPSEREVTLTQTGRPTTSTLFTPR